MAEDGRLLNSCSNTKDTEKVQLQGNIHISYCSFAIQLLMTWDTRVSKSNFCSKTMEVIFVYVGPCQLSALLVIFIVDSDFSRSDCVIALGPYSRTSKTQYHYPTSY